MNIYKEIKEIAKLNSKREFLAGKLAQKIDCEGILWDTAEFVTLSREDIKTMFDPQREVTEDYYVDQSVGYCGDDFYGYLYFKTDVPGQYVKVYFEM